MLHRQRSDDWSSGRQANHLFDLLYGTNRFARRPGTFGIVRRNVEFPNNHNGVNYRMDASLPFLVYPLST
jgi:hypothetical protein